MITLSNLRPAPGSRKPSKRVGRGPGSGHGKTSSRGQKGQRSRSGATMVPGFEGGQMPLQRRLPKRGFKNIFKVYYQVVNVSDFEDFDAGAVVTAEQLKASGKIKTTRRPVKILGNGELNKSLTIRADRFSQSAKQKIEAAGGTVEETSA